MACDERLLLAFGRCFTIIVIIILTSTALVACGWVKLFGLFGQVNIHRLLEALYLRCKGGAGFDGLHTCDKVVVELLLVVVNFALAVVSLQGNAKAASVRVIAWMYKRDIGE